MWLLKFIEWWELHTMALQWLLKTIKAILCDSSQAKATKSTVKFSSTVQNPTTSLPNKRGFYTGFDLPIKIIFDPVNFCHQKPQGWCRCRFQILTREYGGPWEWGSGTRCIKFPKVEQNCNTIFTRPFSLTLAITRYCISLWTITTRWYLVYADLCFIQVIIL